MTGRFRISSSDWTNSSETADGDKDNTDPSVQNKRGHWPGATLQLDVMSTFFFSPSLSSPASFQFLFLSTKFYRPFDVFVVCSNLYQLRWVSN